MDFYRHSRRFASTLTFINIRLDMDIHQRSPRHHIDTHQHSCRLDILLVLVPALRRNDSVAMCTHYATHSSCATRSPPQIPLSGRNPLLAELPRPRLLVLNKSDLADTRTLLPWIRAQNSPECPIHLISAERRDPAAIHRLFDDAQRLIVARAPPPAADTSIPCAPKRRIAVVGIPNVGKSTFINASRAVLLGKCAPVRPERMSFPLICNAQRNASVQATSRA
jgi:hypothetical protein